MPVPNATAVRVLHHDRHTALRMPAQLFACVEAVAQRRGVTVSEFVRTAVAQEVERTL